MEGVENADPSANMDPNGEYDTIGYTIMRMIARQLVAYPDAATQVPTTANGGITNGGFTYTLHVRAGTGWSDGTPVPAQDFELGLKRTCEPELAPLGNPGYYEATIQGFASFCTGLENLVGPGSTSTSLGARQRDPAPGLRRGHQRQRDQHAGRPDAGHNAHPTGDGLPQHHGHALRLGGPLFADY